MYGSTHIYFGGDAQCNSNSNNTAINSSLGGNIFGAGSGIEGGTTVGQVYHSEVVIADNCMVERDVYGGGNYGYVNAGTGHGSDIYIMGGTVSGKVFGGAPVKAGGADFSFQVFAPGTEGGFYHVHKDHEELYFFLAGEGQYQVDGTNIPVKEGSVVRVAPAGKRAVRNTGDKPLVMLCVQYVAAAPGAVNPSDGTILNEPVKW